MKRNKKNMSINSLLKELHQTSKYLTEAYIFNDEEQPEDEMPMDDEIDTDEADEDISQGDQRIAQIREIALSGLQEYADEVDCETYQFFKKIWLMCDKAVSEKDTISNTGK